MLASLPIRFITFVILLDKNMNAYHFNDAIDFSKNKLPI